MFHLRRPRGRRPPRSRDQLGAGPQLRLALLLTVLAGFTWYLLPVGALAVDLPEAGRTAAPLPGLPWLHTGGGRIVDDAGRAVLLRGVNDDALLEDGVRHAGLDETDAQLIEQAGFDVVRLPIAWSRLEPQRGAFDDAYLDQVAAAVALLNRHRLYVVFDMHILDWGPRFGGSGAPSWAALPLLPGLDWWPWDSWRRHLSPAMNGATTYFWLSPDWQADFEATWQRVAARFRDDSGVAGYDLYNEPHPLPLPPKLFEEHWLWPFYARTVAAVGAADPNHLFIVEGTLFGDFGTTVVPLRARDLVYSSHLYTGALVPPGFNGDRGPIDSRIAGQLAEAAELPAPFWSGELGIDHHQDQAAGWADAALDAYDDAGVGWAWWQWRETGGWGIRDAAGTHLDTAFLRHVARPYLVADPGGIVAGRGDGVAGHLELHVGPGAVAALQVAWPALTLGAPEARGACLRQAIWDPATARLGLSVEPGAGCTVTVSRVGS